MKNTTLENVQCITNNFPWDWFFFLIIPLMLLWWYHIYIVNKLLDKIKTNQVNPVEPVVSIIPETNKEEIKRIITSKDDLKIIEGIGPKIEELFNKEGIYTFDQLSRVSPVDMKQILNHPNNGTKFKMHDPGTWAAQALLAKDGKLKELENWQEILKGGKML